MTKPFIALKPSEQTIVAAASRLYAAYVVSGRAQEGQEQQWMERSINEAIQLARTVDDAVQADGEYD